MEQVFVTYSWDNEAHADRVFAFVNFLREEGGIDATMDRFLSQQESAIDFNKMMHRALTAHKKVIIVLSKGYKEKAEAFAGGVGTEYSMIIKDINENVKKYILVSFGGMRNEISPLEFRGREVLDVSQEENITKLYHKIHDVPSYIFSAVSESKPALNSKKSEDFNNDIKTDEHIKDGPIRIEKIISKATSSMAAAQIYQYAVNELQIEIKNVSKVAIHDFAIEIILPVALRPNMHLSLSEFGFTNNGVALVKVLHENRKLFSGQAIFSEKFKIEVNSLNYHQARTAEIIIKVHTDAGSVEQTYKLMDYFTLGGDYSEHKKLDEVTFR